MADKYYGPEKYKGLVKNLPKKERKKYKGKYIGPDKYKGIKPKAKTNPKPPKNIVKTEPKKTYQVTGVSTFEDQSGDILDAYLALAGTELFQYVNTSTIDGAYNDVAIINVLSLARQDYLPNRMIDEIASYINRIWISNGRLYLDIVENSGFDVAVLSLYIMGAATTIAETVA